MCVRISIAGCENDYGYGGCDCTSFNGTYFARRTETATRLYLRDPVGGCGEQWFEVNNACAWVGYVCSRIKRCGPEPCERYDRVALILGERIVGYDCYVYGSLGYFMWVVFYDSDDAPHGLPGQPSQQDMLGAQLVIDGAWQLDQDESGKAICDGFTRSCGDSVSCIAGGADCVDPSTGRFPCRVQIYAIACDQAALACESFPCESCCRGIRPNAVTVTLRNPPSELACLEGWPHNVPLVNNPDCTMPCMFEADVLCDEWYGGHDGQISVTVTRDVAHDRISVEAYFRGATYAATVRDSCESLSLLDLAYKSGTIEGVNVGQTTLRVEANAGGADVTADGFVGICDQKCQPPQLLITIDGFSDIKSPFLGTFEFSRFNGDYVIRAGGSWGYLVPSMPTKCAAYGEIFMIHELLNSFMLWEQVSVELARGVLWNSISFSLRNLTDNSQSFVMVNYSPESEHGEMPWDCEALDVTFTNTLVRWDGKVVRWPVTVRVRLL